MLVVSKKIFYAVEAVLYIAYNAKTTPISGNELAQAQNLPTRYLEAMMQRLVRTGILRGMRGPQGGYMLGRERRRITLADICAALSDKNELPESATQLGQHVLRTTASEMIGSWRETLNNVTIEQLCNKAHDANVPSIPDNNTSFVI
jgi:Rrf2 family iron-sulfur cluster assembly transcriptional regulator